MCFGDMNMIQFQKSYFGVFLPLFDFFQQSGIVGADIGLGERVMPLWPLFID